MNNFASALDIRREVAEMVRPPRRMKVSEAAEKYVIVKVPGGYHGPYRNDKAPYMREPMDTLPSRRHKGVIFCGPAQSGKTQALVDNFLGYTVMCDPADLTIIQTSKDTARDFSMRRVDRMHRNSPEIYAKQSHRRRDDNVFDKQYKTGQIITIGWPSITVLSGKAIKYIVLTDFDRMPLDIDGEGNGYDLAMMRTLTFFSGGMCMAESSPGYEIQDRKWKPIGHQAPPTKGILALYNRGDRRRWHWPCPHCKTEFEPTMKTLVFDDSLPILKAAESVVMVCPNGCVIEPKYKDQMNSAGNWVPEEGRTSDIASFWLQGPAAAFQTWKGLITKELQAKAEYNNTGDYTSWKTTVNTDQGNPFLIPQHNDEIDLDQIKNRAVEVPKRVVPEAVRFLVAQVDVQGNRFEVQIIGVGPYKDQTEYYIIDYFKLALSHRYNSKNESLPVNPGSYLEDWNLITEKVIQKTYPVEGTDKEMPILVTICDTGGTPGVTDNAYKYYEQLKGQKISNKLMLAKGGSAKNAPRIKRSFPDSTARKDREANAKGTIPVYILNTDLIKDKISADLRRVERGNGYYHFPKWLGDWYFKGLTIETRDDKGHWNCPSGARNEPFDLCVYNYGVMIRLGIEKINWSNPPPWARPFNEQGSKIKRKSMIKKVH